MDGTPVFISRSAVTNVCFQFGQCHSEPSEDFRKAFSYPPRTATVGVEYPHHLDVSHRNILEQIPAGSQILEIGCGGGQMRSFVDSRKLTYVGVDISKQRVSEELQKHGGPDLLCDAHFLPFAAESFDVVYSAAVTEHLACPQLVAQQIRRVLKPGGYYLGNVSFLEPWHDQSYFHMSPLGVYELLRQADFEIDHIWPGYNYSGYRALMRMGNKGTKSVAFVGDLMYWVYKTANSLRKYLGSKSGITQNSQIADAARVSGATDWIARKPA